MIAMAVINLLWIGGDMSDDNMSFCDVDSVLNQVEEDEGWRLGKEIPRIAEST
jgi:hypothetical protein